MKKSLFLTFFVLIGASNPDIHAAQGRRRQQSDVERYRRELTFWALVGKQLQRAQALLKENNQVLQMQQQQESQSNANHTTAQQHASMPKLPNDNHCLKESTARQIQAKISELFQTQDNEPAAIRIIVPDQSGLECGLNTVANICAMEAALEPSEKTFIEQSQSAFDALSVNSDNRKSLSNDEIVQIIQRTRNDHSTENIYFGSIGVVHGRENELQVFADPRLSGQTFDSALANLFDSTNQTILLHIILHTRTVGLDRKFRDHWTLLSIIQTSDMHTPVIVVMDSLGNQSNPRPVKPNVRRAVQLLAYRIGIAKHVSQQNALNANRA